MLAACCYLCVLQLLREKLRKYKHNNKCMEDEIVRRGDKVLVLEDAIVTLKRQLHVGGKVLVLVEVWAGRKGAGVEGVKKWELSKHNNECMEDEIT